MSNLGLNDYAENKAAVRIRDPDGLRAARRLATYGSATISSSAASAETTIVLEMNESSLAETSIVYVPPTVKSDGYAEIRSGL